MTMTNNSTQKPSPNPPTPILHLHLHLQQPKSKRHINQATIEKKTDGIRQYRSRLLQRKGNASGVKSADLSNHQESRKSNTQQQQHVRQQRGGQEQEGTTSKETRHRHNATKTRKTPGYISSTLKEVSPMPTENAIVIAKRNDLDTVGKAPEEKRDLPVALQIELNALIQESSKPEQPINPTARPTSVGKSKESNSVNYILIHELIEEAFFLCEDCRDVLCQGELDDASELSVRVDREMTESMEFNGSRMPIYDPLTVTENFREKTKEVIEFAKALEEEVQLQMEESKVKVEVEEEEVDRLDKLLPKALWMC